MKIVFTLIITIICAACSGIKHRYPKEISLVPRSPKINDLSNKFSVMVKADSLQNATGTGLKFSIKISNKQENAVFIANPIDVLRLTLSNKGADVLLPHALRALMYTLPNAKFPFEAFDILKTEVNGMQNADNLEEIKQIGVPGKGSYEIFFSITKSVQPSAVKPYRVEEAEKLPNGIYVLFISMSIRQDNKFESFHSPPVLIRYGNSCCLPGVERKG